MAMMTYVGGQELYYPDLAYLPKEELDWVTSHSHMMINDVQVIKSNKK